MERLMGVIANASMFGMAIGDVYNLILTSDRIIAVFAVGKSATRLANSLGPFLGLFVSVFAWPLGDAIGKGALDKFVSYKAQQLDSAQLDTVLNSHPKNFQITYDEIKEVLIAPGKPEYYVEIYIETETNTYRFYPKRFKQKGAVEENMYDKYVAILREAVPSQKLKFAY